MREIVRRGHAVENHSQHHSTAFGWYGPARLRREIAAAQGTLAALAGRTPAFFRAPFGVRNPFVDPVLARLGLTYVSWTRRGYDTVDERRGRASCGGSRPGSTPATCSCCTTASRRGAAARAAGGARGAAAAARARRERGD